MDKNRWGVINSAHVGLSYSHKRWVAMQRYMEKRGVQFDFVQSEGAGSVERLAKMLGDNEYHTVVIVGNDEALNEALNGVMRSESLPEDFALGLIPNGIGNDFARFWGVVENDYKKTIDMIIARRTRRIDVGYVVYPDEDNVPQKRYFLNCVNVGLGARLIDLTSKANRLVGSKRLSTIPVAIANIFERKSFNVWFKADTEEIKGEVMSICVGNCTGYGQTPNAVPYSGMLDVSVVTLPQWWQLFEGFYLLGKGKFLNYKNVHPYRIQKMELFDVGKARVSLDGCMLDSKQPTPMRIEIIPECLNYIV